jgi:glycosyltransferase involved in cell wall biosynthesis
MKLSVLIPTRDRLRYLRYAVDSVVRQGASVDWEVVISDNDSREDVASYVAELDDQRIRYIRTARAVPVTENWNNALGHSTGDYVIMLGDDDALLPGYFETIDRLVEQFEAPDAIYHGALLYTYPGVEPAAPMGYLQPYGYAPFLQRARDPYRLDPREARALVRAAMNFRVRYGFNMQFATVRRATIDALRDGGDFYRTRFPDYYAMNLLLLRAKSIVAEPRPCVVIGVTPKSYGFFHLNKREAEGRAMLEADDSPAARARQPLLPGTNINTGWLLALEGVSAQPGVPADLAPNYRRYRQLQIIHTYRGYYVDGTTERAELDELRRHLGRVERWFYELSARVVKVGASVLPAAGRRVLRGTFDRALRQFPRYDPGRDPRSFATMTEVFDAVDPGSYPARFR